MLQMIAGTIKNAVKLDMLSRSWEQKKNSNQILSRKKKNDRANMSQEQRMLEQFKEQMAQNRESSRNAEIASKIMNGEDLTREEEQYLAQNNPGQLSNYRQVKAERAAYEEKLKKCKTKDEVQRLKTNTMNAYLAELKAAPGCAKAAKAMEILGKVKNVLKAEKHFIEAGGYAKLPTEADEAIDRAEERSKENEEVLEILMESAESNVEKPEISESEESLDLEKAETNDNSDVDIEMVHDEKKKEPKPKEEEKDPLEEIEEICRLYIPSVSGDTAAIKNDSTPRNNEKGSTINLAM